MAEENKEKTSSGQNSSGDEKKQSPTVSGSKVVVPPASSPKIAPRPAGIPARPVPTPAVSPAKAQDAKRAGRRSFLKVLFAVGAVLSIAPFVPWNAFLSGSVEAGSGTRYFSQKVVIDDLPKYGAAAGVHVNVNDLVTFPPNDHWVFTYPTSGDPSLDAENPDTFVKYELIRLPVELGGSSKQATDFVAFSKVCVHLWCSPNYNPEQTVNPNENGYQSPTGPSPGTKHEQYECPCHGSIYQIPDGLAIGGPASLQPSPTNAIPMLTLQADSKGNLFVFYPNYDPASEKTPQSNPSGVAPDGGNGTLGYGRDYLSYENFIKPRGQIPANPDDQTKVAP